MKDPRCLAIGDYNYDLPVEKIAKYPLSLRDSSRLLVYKEGVITEDFYRNVASLLPVGSLLVFNETKVIEARLRFQKSSGGVIEIFCLEPHEQYPDVSSAMLEKQKVLWQCLVGGASKWKHGQVLKKILVIDNQTVSLQARFVEKRNNCFVIALEWDPGHFSFAEILHQAGDIPLPPYLHREAEELDKERYQTVYAKAEGSVAAPTAGLHFTGGILKSLDEKGVSSARVTLHVGAGTFQPVKTPTMGLHLMHTEWMEVKKETIRAIYDNLKNPIIAVGTTSLRTLESLYWAGIKILRGLKDDLSVGQWDPYNEPVMEDTRSVLLALQTWMEEQEMETLQIKTSLLIAPGYQFRVVKGLITNFHQPNSTLLLLVAALVGEDWKNIYRYALDNDFRFLSYGDGSLLWAAS